MRYFTKHLIYSCLVICFFRCTTPCLAASLVSSSAINTATKDDEILIHVKFSITASNDTIYYLRGVFFTPGSSNYCGYTWNGTTYYSGPYTGDGGWKNFLKIAITNNQWEGDVKVKIDTDDSGCRDSGGYSFKIERFTESGSGTFDSQEILPFTFTLPTITFPPTPTLKPTATPRPISTVKVPTPTKTVSTTSSITTLISAPPEQPGVTLSQKHSANYLQYTSTEEAVLGEATESAMDAAQTASASPTFMPTSVLGSSTSLWPLFFSTIGGGIVVICAILAVRIYKKATNE